MAKIGELVNLGFRRLGSTGTANVEKGSGKINAAAGFRDIADDFAGTQRPKLKFNYTVHFKFRDPVKIPGNNGEIVKVSPRDDGNIGSVGMDEMVFAIKQASRPNPTYTYEDINYYNFRTKVATKLDYGNLQVTLYDDVQNLAHSLFEFYLKCTSPIANTPCNPTYISQFDDGEFGPKNRGFNSPLDPFRKGSSSLGPLPSLNDKGGPSNGRLGLFECITIRHYYFDPLAKTADDQQGPPTASQFETEESTGVDAASKISYVDYQFINPRVVNMTLDELDMTQSEASTVMFNFNYDSVYIKTRDRSFGIASDATTAYDTVSVNDVRATAIDLQREFARIRRLDTLPDISAFEIADFLLPPTTNPLAVGVLNAIDSGRAVIDKGVDAVLDLPNLPDAELLIPDANGDLVTDIVDSSI